MLLFTIGGQAGAVELVARPLGELRMRGELPQVHIARPGFSIDIKCRVASYSRRLLVTLL